MNETTTAVTPMSDGQTRTIKEHDGKEKRCADYCRKLDGMLKDLAEMSNSWGHKPGRGADYGLTYDISQQEKQAIGEAAGHLLALRGIYGHYAATHAANKAYCVSVPPEEWDT